MLNHLSISERSLFFWNFSFSLSIRPTKIPILVCQEALVVFCVWMSWGSDRTGNETPGTVCGTSAHCKLILKCKCIWHHSDQSHRGEQQQAPHGPEPRHVMIAIFCCHEWQKETIFRFQSLWLQFLRELI